MRSFCFLCFLLTVSLEAKSHFLQEMKHHLHQAEKELQQAHSRVLCLRETIARKEIVRIAEEIEDLEGSYEERLDFLDLRRKNIACIMNEVPSCLDEAQEVLDHILVAITDLKENQQLNGAIVKEDRRGE